MTTRTTRLARLLLIPATLMIFSACAQKKENVSITLEENSTTGYQWSYTAQPEGVLKEVKSDYSASSSTLAGAPGAHTWEFEPMGDGTVTLTFTYARSWETDEPPADTIVYTFEVKNGVATPKQ